MDIIPNWHPVFVHFTVGLLSASALLFIARALVRGERLRSELETGALWMLWTGAAFTLATVGSGIYAFLTVAHDDAAHEVMKEHRNLALATAALFLGLAGWSAWRTMAGKAVPRLLRALVVAGVLLLGATAWHGGELVYRHGVGVMSLPQADGEGHDHDHGAAEGSADIEKTVAADRAAPAPDVATPQGTVDAFHRALAAGDREAALALLDPEVLIFESGYAERSADEYSGHHLPADMAFSQAMAREVTERRVEIFGATAVVASETRTRGSFRGKDYDLAGTETMVLRSVDGGWRITHIHWSSSPAGE